MELVTETLRVALNSAARVEPAWWARTPEPTGSGITRPGLRSPALTDDQMAAVFHACLTELDLLPSERWVDTGYANAGALVAARRRPALADEPSLCIAAPPTCRTPSTSTRTTSA